MKKITYILFALLTFNLGFGQSIFTNPITDPNPSTANPYTSGQTVDANITVTGIGFGTPGLAGNVGANRYNAKGWGVAALNLSDYFEFTITPNAGYDMDFVSFVYNGRASPTGPDSIAFRSSLDGYSSDIGTPTIGGTSIDLSSSTYQDILTSITFRIYCWGATSGLGTFSINDFTFNGTVSAYPCPSTVTYNGTWSGTPDATTEVIIAANYNTASGNISACSLIINAGITLTVDNGDFVEVEHDVTVDGNLVVETQGNFVQNDDAGTFTLNAGGLASVNKQTASKADWFYYTYWSSPVIGETIIDAFPDVDGDRRFWFNGANFLDTNGDDIDDNGDDWQPAFSGDTMIPGVGYASTESRFHFPGASGLASFEGPFNTGDVSIGISNNPANVIASWNFIGNPYPSAIDFDIFYAANSTVVDGAAYFWSQASLPVQSNPGNEQSNFSKNDYATYTVGSGGVAGGSPVIPTQYIPSGQGFFIAGIDNNPVTFTNAMRMADGTSNTQFFRNSNSKKKTVSTIANRLWINLNSDNGVFSQILLAYVEGATDDNDGLSFDAPKLVNQDYAAILYSSMNSDNKKYVIQGKSIDSINEDESINLGFSTTIQSNTEFILSIALLEGEFLTSNSVYLKDNLLSTLHDLSVSDYTFTSEVGEFNERFEIAFSANALSTETVSANANALKIIELADNHVQFTASKAIKSVRIFDLLGRQLYNFKGQSNSETYKLSNLNSAA